MNRIFCTESVGAAEVSFRPICRQFLLLHAFGFRFLPKDGSPALRSPATQFCRIEQEPRRLAADVPAGAATPPSPLRSIPPPTPRSPRRNDAPHSLPRP